MISAISNNVMVIVAAVLGLAIGGAVTYLIRDMANDIELKQLEPDSGWAYEVRPTKTASSISTALSAWNHKRKSKKAYEGGYVRWYLFNDSGWPRPKMVKPERKEGGSIRELKKDDKTYLFPAGKGRVAKDDGVTVFAHHVDSAEPLDLSTGLPNRTDPGVLARFLDARVTVGKKPGLGLGLGDFSTRQLIGLAFVVVVGLAVMSEMGIL